MKQNVYDDLVTSMAKTSRLGYIGTKPGTRNSNAWFTPAIYIEAARAVLGEIDFDPFSDEAANNIVKAKRILTVKDDAFTADWGKCKTVWMNPPYGRDCRAAIEKFIREFQCGSFQTGITLVNNATETRFFQALLQTASAVCFTDHRIAFWNSDGKVISGNTRGQAFFLFSKKASVKAFRKSFEPFGKVISL
jgi:DNA N-6-adenine-methyltransferase Dam